MIRSIAGVGVICLVLAAATAAWSCPGLRQVAGTAAEARAHCGPKPTTGGPWKCIGLRHATTRFNSQHQRECGTPTGPWRWSWTAPGDATYSDDWHD